VPEVQKLLLSTLTARLLRTESADLPRLAGLDPDAVRDLRIPRHDAESSNRPGDAEPVSPAS
jgi:hypothetical protein